jgi:hypothetical protein
MAITPNTNFTSGQILTAAQQNRFPRGIMAYQTLEFDSTTSATHTTYQDNGTGLTITTVAGRLYRIVYTGHPYPSGGLQSMKYQVVLGASTVLDDWVVPDAALNPGVSALMTSPTIYEATTSGSQTFKIQFGAVTANTAVRDFGSSTTKRQFFIEDIGAA